MNTKYETLKYFVKEWIEFSKRDLKEVSQITPENSFERGYHQGEIDAYNQLLTDIEELEKEKEWK